MYVCRDGAHRFGCEHSANFRIWTKETDVENQHQPLLYRFPSIGKETALFVPIRMIFIRRYCWIAFIQTRTRSATLNGRRILLDSVQGEREGRHTQKEARKKTVFTDCGVEGRRDESGARLLRYAWLLSVRRPDWIQSRNVAVLWMAPFSFSPYHSAFVFQPACMLNISIVRLE